MMIGIMERSRGGCRRRLCDRCNSMDASVEVRQGYPIGYRRGVKVKSYMIDEE